MTAPASIPAPRYGRTRFLSLHERTELRLGRTHWTPADYREAGRREFDDLQYRNDGSPWRPSDREHYADCYVRMFCPPAKLRRTA